VNFFLRNIESSLDERFLLIGEKLLEEGQPTQFDESERNLWIARVERFEVEIQISPSRVKAFSCECETFQKEGMCGHIAASLLALRRRLSEKPARTTREKSRPKTYKKLTVNAILENLSQEELSNFVLSFAKMNPAFSLVLKARFAANVPMDDNSLKYGLVLESAISNNRKRDGTIGPNGTRQLAQLANELLRQAGDALALQHFATCLDLLKSLIEKLPPVLNKCQDPDDSMLAVLAGTMEKWEALVASHLPPAFRETLWNYFMQEMLRPVNRMHAISDKMLALSYTLATEKVKWVALLEFARNELSKYHLSSEYRTALMRVQVCLVHKKGMKIRAREFYKEVLTGAHDTLFVVQLAREEGLWGCVHHLSKEALRQGPDGGIRRKLEDALLEVALHENDTTTVLRLSKQRFLETGNLEFYRLCRKHASGDWPAFRQSILTQLTSDSFSEILASVYAEEKMTGELLELISKKGTLRDLVRYDAHLIGIYPGEVTTLYRKHLTTYLNSHLGEVPAGEVKRLINHLHKIGGRSIAASLIVFVKKKYPHRNSLREEFY
jgi:hypothetical protein